MFSSSDFPGLDGNTASLQMKVIAPDNEGKKLVGYASALLKKNDTRDDSTAKVAKSAAGTAVPTSKFPEMDGADDDNNMTQAMEKEILSEFHDLSIIGSEDFHRVNNDNSSNGKDDAHNHHHYGTPSTADDKTEGITVETSPSSTENGVASSSPQSNNGNSVSILPETCVPKTPESTVNTHQLTISRVDLDEKGSSSSSPPAAPPVLSADDKVKNNVTQNAEVETPKPPTAWGSKRLFADVVASQSK
jgi:hypothetical protein